MIKDPENKNDILAIKRWPNNIRRHLVKEKADMMMVMTMIIMTIMTNMGDDDNGDNDDYTWQAKEGPVQPADIQLRIDRPEAETTVEVIIDQRDHFIRSHR